MIKLNDWEPFATRSSFALRPGGGREMFRVGDNHRIDAIELSFGQRLARPRGMADDSRGFSLDARTARQDQRAGEEEQVEP